MQDYLIPVEERSTPREKIQTALSERGFAATLNALREFINENSSLADYSFAATILRQFGPEGARIAGLQPNRTFIARSVTVEPFLSHIIVEAALAGVWLEVAVGGYGSFIDELTNPAGAMSAYRPDLVLIVVDVEDIAGDLRQACARGAYEQAVAAAQRAGTLITRMLRAARDLSGARILVQGLAVPAHLALGPVIDANIAGGEAELIHTVNRSVAETCRSLGDCLLFDVDGLAGTCGRRQWRDDRLFYSSRLPIAAEMFHPYCRALARNIRVLCLPARKVLCTDLDNTLWGGILGEDGVSGIRTGIGFPGNCFLAYQRYLKELSTRGILLAIASKNNLADVQEAFRRRHADMAIHLEDFTIVQIGWNDKTDALRCIAKELNLGIDSIVFVDDNPVECEQIHQQLPEVLVVEAPAQEPWRLPSVIMSIPAFDAGSITGDDRRRGQEYKAQIQRSQLEASAVSREDFLRSLGIVVEAVDANEAPLARVVQLLQKTNQFNMTTRRHSSSEVERIVALPMARAIALRYRDRFGDGGVVGVGLCYREGDCCVIDSFLLSCRVIGRGVETALLSYIDRHARAIGCSRLRGEFIPTAKNRVCAEFYANHGFELTSKDEKGRLVFQRLLPQRALELPDWISEE